MTTKQRQPAARSSQVESCEIALSHILFVSTQLDFIAHALDAIGNNGKDMGADEINGLETILARMGEILYMAQEEIENAIDASTPAAEGMVN